MQKIRSFENIGHFKKMSDLFFCWSFEKIRSFGSNIFIFKKDCVHPWSEEPVLAAEVPTAPVNVQLVQVTDASVTLKWEVPEQSGGSRVKGYSIKAQQKGTKKLEYVSMCNAKKCKEL